MAPVPSIFAEREKAAWELWPNEHDREKALKSGKDGNIRPTHPFMLAWDRAFKEVFGDTPPRARLGTGVRDDWNIFVRINKNPPSVDRPNGWWTTELPEAHASTPARQHASTSARKHIGTFSFPRSERCHGGGVEGWETAIAHAPETLPDRREVDPNNVAHE